MRRKYFLIMTVALLSLSGCKQNNSSQVSASSEKTEAETTTVVETTSEQTTTNQLSVEELRASADRVESQPFLHCYTTDDSTKFTQIDSYENTWVYYHDIGCIYGFASEDAEIAYEDYATTWLNQWNAYEDAASTKIGYEVSIELTNGTGYVDTITEPSDTAEIFEYVECYLYDDVHQIPGAWYSHLLEEDITSDTLITSIKLTTGKLIEDVKAITLTVFTYQSDQDFDGITGRYIGGNYQEISIGQITGQ